MSQGRPLDGIKVLELGSLIAGPFCTRILGEFGAEVIKIEPPKKGDPLRTWSLTTEHGSLWSMVQSRNKKSVTVDLHRPEGQEIVRKLAAQVDVLVENFRPGKLAEWGLGYEQLREVNPRLVMVSISGYGQNGPYYDRVGFGSVGESMGGIRHVTGFSDGPPLRVGISLGDSLASLYAVIGVLLALYHRDMKGTPEGQYIDVALYEAVFSLMESMLPEYDYSGVIRNRKGNLLLGAAPSNVYETKDGRWLTIGGNADNIFRRLMSAIGRPEVADDPRYANNKLRIKNVSELDEMIGAWVKTKTMDEALDALNQASVPAGPVYNIQDIANDPHYQAREMILTVNTPVGPLKMPGIVPKMSATPGKVEWSGPALGANAEEILGKYIGISEEELAELRAKEVV
ncbi:MAG: CoA transferase [Actinobacteria bacterium]|nr:CoA transferase [Actinomycetota bacterium]